MKVLVIHGWQNLTRMETDWAEQNTWSQGTVQLPTTVFCSVRVAQVVNSKEAYVTLLLPPACT